MIDSEHSRRCDSSQSIIDSEYPRPTRSTGILVLVVLLRPTDLDVLLEVRLDVSLDVRREEPASIVSS
jgi:hypothetical protein